MICRKRPDPWAKITRLERLVKKLRAERAELHELITPFVLHGLAQKVFARRNMLEPISTIGVSALCVGAYQGLIEFLDPKEWPVIGRHKRDHAALAAKEKRTHG